LLIGDVPFIRLKLLAPRVPFVRYTWKAMPLREDDQCAHSQDSFPPTAMVKSRTAKRLSERLLASRLINGAQLAEALLAVGEDEERLLAHLLDQGLLTPFQARQLRRRASGFHVGNYVVVDYLGRGGNSLVFKAQH